MVASCGWLGICHYLLIACDRYLSILWRKKLRWRRISSSSAKRIVKNCTKNFYLLYGSNTIARAKKKKKREYKIRRKTQKNRILFECFTYNLKQSNSISFSYLLNECKQNTQKIITKFYFPYALSHYFFWLICVFVWVLSACTVFVYVYRRFFCHIRF